jgi:hypothetical protein
MMLKLAHSLPQYSQGERLLFLRLSIPSWDTTLLQRRSRNLVSWWEEDTVSLLADLGKRAGRRGQRIRNKREIAHGRGPVHLCGVADESAGKPTVDRVVVPDIEPLVNAAPDDCERHGPRRRWGVSPSNTALKPVT